MTTEQATRAALPKAGRQLLETLPKGTHFILITANLNETGPGLLSNLLTSFSSYQFPAADDMLVRILKTVTQEIQFGNQTGVPIRVNPEETQDNPYE